MKTKIKPRRMADDITAGMQQLQEMMAQGKTPDGMGWKCSSNLARKRVKKSLLANPLPPPTS
jgi:hypothetical protein